MRSRVRDDVHGPAASIRAYAGASWPDRPEPPPNPTCLALAYSRLPETNRCPPPLCSGRQGRRPMKIIAALAICLIGTAASAQTLDDLKNDGKKTDNILTYRMGYPLH